MSVTPPPTTMGQLTRGLYYLSPFDKTMAAAVARWVEDSYELFLLAPKTPPPVTESKVLAWPESDGQPLVFGRKGSDQPIGYLELNPMPKQRQRFWVGHCIIRPDQRGLGLGKQMMLLILDEAFCNRKAKQVSLVVFPENVVAIRCYERVGFVEIGEQIKFFHTSGQEHRMLQMAIDRTKYKTMPASVEPR